MEVFKKIGEIFFPAKCEEVKEHVYIVKILSELSPYAYEDEKEANLFARKFCEKYSVAKERVKIFKLHIKPKAL